MRVGLFLLSLALTLLGIGVTYGPMVLSLVFYGGALHWVHSGCAGINWR